MILFQDISLQQEQQLTGMLFGYILKSTFDAGNEFDHMYQSTGEAVCASFVKLGYASATPGGCTLVVDECGICADLNLRRGDQMPLFEDVLTLAIAVAEHWDSVHLNPMTGKFACPALVGDVLSRVGAIDREFRPRPGLFPVLIDNYFVYNSTSKVSQIVSLHYEPVVEKIALESLDLMPPEISEKIRDYSFYQITGLLNSCWRYGVWFSDEEQERLLPLSPHRALAFEVAKRIELLTRQKQC